VNAHLARLVTRLYPRAWRERYGEEFEALLIAERASIRSYANVVRSAIQERLFPSTVQAAEQLAPTFGVMVLKPSALAPMAMSLAALATVLLQLAIFGAARQPDEGPAAHLWQLLMAGQVPVLLLFAGKWLPRAPRQAMWVIALQAAAILASMAPVFLLKW
jgi:hypothetical protein